MKIKNIAIMIFFVALGILCLRYAGFNSSYASSNFATDTSTIFNVGCTAAHGAQVPDVLTFTVSLAGVASANASMTGITNPVNNDTTGQHGLIAAAYAIYSGNSTIQAVFNGPKLMSRSVCLGAASAPTGILQGKADATTLPLILTYDSESPFLTDYVTMGTNYSQLATGPMDTDNVTVSWGSNSTNKFGFGFQADFSAQTPASTVRSRTITFNLGVSY